MYESILELAKSAYSAYGAATDWKNYQGNTMPQWDDLPDKIKLAWACAASSTQLKVLESVYTTPPMVVGTFKKKLYPKEEEKIRQRLLDQLSKYHAKPSSLIPVSDYDVTFVQPYSFATEPQDLTDPVPDLTAPGTHPDTHPGAQCGS